MHKISEDFGTTESVKFVIFARLLRSLVWISLVKRDTNYVVGVPQVAELGDPPKEVSYKSTLKKWYVVSGKLMLRVKIADKLYPRKSGSRSSESGASSVFEQAILSGTWLSRFGEQCLFDF
ncbi:hypothetical protein TB2_040067 [Malus domestica]